MRPHAVAFAAATAIIFVYYVGTLAVALNHIFREQTEDGIDPRLASIVAATLYAVTAFALVLYLTTEFLVSDAAPDTFEWRVGVFSRSATPALLVATLTFAILVDSGGLLTIYDLPLLSPLSTLTALLVPATASLPLFILAVYAVAPQAYQSRGE